MVDKEKKFKDVLVSDFFGVSKEILESLGVADRYIIEDIPLFIDLKLLKNTDVPEFNDSHDLIESYFKDLILLLDNVEVENKIRDPKWEVALSMIQRGDLQGLGLGYSIKGKGAGFGELKASAVLHNLRSLIKIGVKDPAIFDLIGAFNYGVGSDLISDLISHVLEKRIIEYTNRMIDELKVDRSKYENIHIKNREGETIYTLIKNPREDKHEPIYLVPREILSDLPIFMRFEDLDYVTSINDRVKVDANYLVKNQLVQQRKENLFKLLLEDKDFREEYIRTYKKIDGDPYDFTLDKAYIYKWKLLYDQELTKRHVQHFNYEKISKDLSVLDITLDILNTYNHYLDDCGIANILKASDSRYHEKILQSYLHVIGDMISSGLDIDFSRESNAGRGPIDFKLSRGMEKVAIEMKLSSNNQLTHGFEKQLPTYMRSESCEKGVYLIMKNNDTSMIKTILENPNKDIKVLIIDITAKKSASVV